MKIKPVSRIDDQRNSCQFASDAPQYCSDRCMNMQHIESLATK